MSFKNSWEWDLLLQCPAEEMGTFWPQVTICQFARWNSEEEI